MKDKIKNSKWFPYAVAGCIIVAFYMLLSHFSGITAGLGTFIGFFKSVILGIVLAYIMNPLAKLLYRKVFGKIKKEGLRWTASVAGAVIITLAVIVFLLGTLIPQLIDSIATLVGNMDMYLASLEKLLVKLGMDGMVSSSEELGMKISDWLTKNANSVLNISAAAASTALNWVIAVILSIYMLSAKHSFKEGFKQLLRVLIRKDRFEITMRFLSRCDRILVRYITSSLIDSVIVGLVNALFMTVFRMEYVGLVSVLVAVTNLIPTFGPIIGGALGGFILVLVNPWHALAFILFTVVLQILDGYIIKPKLFGNSLGVSGLLILVSVIVCGNMFGIIGILIAIPLAAILNYVYFEALMPALEANAAKRDARL